MANTGKIFEQSFKKSVPENVLLYRLPDAAQSFGNNNQLRFSRKNPFDYLMWDSTAHVLYALELKTVQRQSISFERNKDEHGEIHYHQICGLNEWDRYDGITCGFVIEFRDIATTIFIDIKQFNKLMDVVPKKSFRISDLEANDIEYVVIPQRKIRTRYAYDIDGFLKIQNNLIDT
ncbi:MAG: hypothetical protein LUC91_00735 [Prevotella sp.]|nr:hypothetical protein [Prevotella sp.]